MITFRIQAQETGALVFKKSYVQMHSYPAYGGEEVAYDISIKPEYGHSYKDVMLSVQQNLPSKVERYSNQYKVYVVLILSVQQNLPSKVKRYSN